MNDDAPSDTPSAGQKTVVRILAVVLIIGGLLAAIALKRLPLPLRLTIGLGDMFAGLVLLVLIQQKSRR